MAELKMLRSGVTWMDRIKNECIRGTVQVGRRREKVRVQTEMLWTCPEQA